MIDPATLDEWEQDAAIAESVRDPGPNDHVLALVEEARRFRVLLREVLDSGSIACNCHYGDMGAPNETCSVCGCGTPQPCTCSTCVLARRLVAAL